MELYYSESALHRAVYKGEVDKIRELLQQGEYTIDCVSYYSMETSLHIACQLGNLAIVRVLVSEFQADMTRKDHLNRTALMIAASGGHTDVALALLRDYQCPMNIQDNIGRGVLHYACQGSSVSLVRALILEFKADVNAKDDNNETPFYQAACNYWELDIALALIKEFGCDPKDVERNGTTLLHLACRGKNINLVRTLILDYKFDVNVPNRDGDTPLQLATSVYYRNGAELEVAQSLTEEFGCDPITCNVGNEILIEACKWNNTGFVETLLKFFSPLLTNNEGDTPLHLVSKADNLDCVKSLVAANAPLSIKNNKGKSPIDIAGPESKAFLVEYFDKNHDKLHDYSAILKHARKKYSDPHYVTRMFVLGNLDVGKTTFIESLKREGFFESFSKVSESSVLTHTAGIIPSVHMSKHYGRILFYDFSGGAEYYSSHVAILESLASSKKGNNIFVVVIDLKEDGGTIGTNLHFWFSFIRYLKFGHFSLIFVGSHLDISDNPYKGNILARFCGAAKSNNMHKIDHFRLDCRNPRSSHISLLKKHVFQWIKESSKYKLSCEASVLLGLLEKDFSACSAQTLATRIKESGLCLPAETKSLHPILSELQDVGVLLLVGNSTKHITSYLMWPSLLMSYMSYSFLSQQFQTSKNHIQDKAPVLILEYFRNMFWMGSSLHASPRSALFTFNTARSLTLVMWA